MLLEILSEDLQLPKTYLFNKAKAASFLYKTYEISKRGGGRRIIHHPSMELKAVQRWLLQNVISGLPVLEDVALAYRKGINVAENARRHVDSKYLLRMDFSNFFPSITDKDIRNYIETNNKLFDSWVEEDIWVFTSLVCRFGRLTIGAPTSPSLSNALCRQMDMEIRNICDEIGVIYTRYADDLFFSVNAQKVLASVEQKVRRIVNQLNCPANLRINRKKTRHLSKKQKRAVTGIILSSDGKISLGRAAKRKIRSLVYKVEKLTPNERQELAGMLAYCKSIEPDFINRLISKFKAERVIKAQLAGSRG